MSPWKSSWKRGSLACLLSLIALCPWAQAQEAAPPPDDYESFEWEPDGETPAPRGPGMQQPPGGQGPGIGRLRERFQGGNFPSGGGGRPNQGLRERFRERMENAGQGGGFGGGGFPGGGMQERGFPGGGFPGGGRQGGGFQGRGGPPGGGFQGGGFQGGGFGFGGRKNQGRPGKGRGKGQGNPKQAQAMIERLKQIDPQLAQEYEAVQDKIPAKTKRQFMRQMLQQFRQMARERGGMPGQKRGQAKIGQEFQDLARLEIRTMIDATKVASGELPQAKLQESLEALFDQKLSAKAKRIEELEAKLKDLKAKMQERQGHRDKIVTQRMKELLGPSRSFDW